MEGEHRNACWAGPSVQRRKDVVVVTKCGVDYPDRPKGRDSRMVSILASVDQVALVDLQTDYLDVLLVHWPDVNTPFEETMHALDSVVRQGKVRAVGVSNFTIDQIKECEATRPHRCGPVRSQHVRPAIGARDFPTTASNKAPVSWFMDHWLLAC